MIMKRIPVIYFALISFLILVAISLVIFSDGGILQQKNVSVHNGSEVSNLLIPPPLGGKSLSVALSFENICRTRSLQPNSRPSKIECSMYPEHTFLGNTPTYSVSEGLIYYNGDLVVDADKSTFIALWKYIGEDKDGLFYKTERIKGSDHEMFKTFGENDQYATDGYRMYTQFGILEGAEVESFEVFDSHYAKDKDTVFFDGVPLDDVDTPTFEVLEMLYTRDKNYLFYYNNKIKGSDPSTFEWLVTDKAKSYTYAKDGNLIYKYGIPFRGIDVDTFEFLSNEYYKDKNNVYRSNGSVILHADPATFFFWENIESAFCSIKQDKNYIFSCYFDAIFEGADKESFRGMDPFYVDNTHVWTEKGVLFDADRESLEILGNGFVKDKNTVWLVGEYRWIKEVEESDVTTFEIVGDVYGDAQDKNAIYFIMEREPLNYHGRLPLVRGEIKD